MTREEIIKGRKENLFKAAKLFILTTGMDAEEQIYFISKASGVPQSVLSDIYYNLNFFNEDKRSTLLDRYAYGEEINE